MDREEKQVAYQSLNTYQTLNRLTPDTRTVWMAFHGIGYLSRYFIAYFKDLDPATNYIIAPQAPSKYYQDKQYKHIGASWLTRENKVQEIGNVLNYVEAVYQAEAKGTRCRQVVFGFSQGVSVALRWVAHCKVPCNHLILYAGGIPDELRAEDFDFLGNDSNISLYVGDEDPYLTPARMNDEQDKLSRLFRGRARIVFFKGGHEIQTGLLNDMVE